MGADAEGPGVDSILVIDDEARMRTLLQRILALQGYSVLTAEGPEPTVAALAAEHVDLVLLDLVLGPHSGL